MYNLKKTYINQKNQKFSNCSKKTFNLFFLKKRYFISISNLTWQSIPFIPDSIKMQTADYRLSHFKLCYYFCH